jgi:hypothetical protein
VTTIGLQEQLDQVSAALGREVMAKREQVLRAFVAETGLYPTECRLVEELLPIQEDYIMRYRVRLERLPGLPRIARFTPREACVQPGEGAALQLAIPSIEEGAELIRVIAKAMQTLAQYPEMPAVVGLRGCLLP